MPKYICGMRKLYWLLDDEIAEAGLGADHSDATSTSMADALARRIPTKIWLELHESGTYVRLQTPAEDLLRQTARSAR
ncbi:hypothetical protein [Bradyrhizobium canariense]|uniref:hypothetical protein n=1 Tax=Bradyrhizobium canariense TaxID=255045 RepID=UPI001959D87F|nr:hypothetical protein [Bradyrhizobium canariense]MBM7487918.1 hypothetical protein [Bradyrhizobium canariense]